MSGVGAWSDGAALDLAPAGGATREHGSHNVGIARQLLAKLSARWVELVVGLAALIPRLGVILRHDGISGVIGYDCGVYFAGADALIHGRMPYRDFTMLHPPGITLILTPLAALTHVMTDWHAFVIATLVFCLLGAVNAVLVVTVCRRLGCNAFAAGTAGLFYAAWFGSVSAEFQVKLEPLGNFFLLCGLLAILRAQRKPTRWATVLAGVLLGLTLTIKIWWGVPVLALIIWHAWRARSLRSGGQLALGAAISVAVVYTPFFIADPTGMFSSVVSDQLGRPRDVSTGGRLSSLSSVPQVFRHMSESEKALTTVPFVVLTGLVLVLAWRASTLARVAVALVVIQLAVLLTSPSWITYYADYVAVSLAISVGAAMSGASATRLSRLRWAPSALITVVMVAITTTVTITGNAAIKPYAGAAQLTRAVRHVPCLMTTSTTLLIRLDALSRGLAAGCPNWIDITGRTYGPDKGPTPRSANLKWRLDLEHYLLSGDAIVLRNPAKVGVTGGVAKAIRRGGILVESGGHKIYRVYRVEH